MKNYIIPSLYVDKFSIHTSKLFSLAARDQRQLFTKNKKSIKLTDLLATEHIVGKEIGSASYLPESRYRFVKTGNISSNFLLEESKVEKCMPKDRRVCPKRDNILIAKDGVGKGIVVLDVLSFGS